MDSGIKGCIVEGVELRVVRRQLGVEGCEKVGGETKECGT